MWRLGKSAGWESALDATCEGVFSATAVEVFVLNLGCGGSLTSINGKYGRVWANQEELVDANRQSALVEAFES
jgi:hypothetical protein